MSSNSRFAGLKQQSNSAPVETMPVPSGQERNNKGRNPREGKKAVVGYFSPAVSKGLHLLAIDHNSSIQALLGEAIDDLMRKYGKHPFGEK
jgi:hypothetical protein